MPGEDENEADLPDDDGTTIPVAARVNVPVGDFLLRREDFQGHGFTGGCRGRAALQRGLTPVGHIRECHRRMAGLTKGGNAEARGRVERAESRMKRPRTDDHQVGPVSDGPGRLRR